MSTGSCYAQCQGGECSVGGLGNLPLLCAASSALQWHQLHKLNIESREHLRTKSTISKFLFWSLLFVGQNLFWEDGTLQSDANIYKHNNQGLTLTFPVSLLSVQFISEINVVCAHTRACPTSQHRHRQYYICNVYIYTLMHWNNHMQIIAITGKLLLCFFPPHLYIYMLKFSFENKRLGRSFSVVHFSIILCSSDGDNNDAQIYVNNDKQMYT